MYRICSKAKILFFLILAGILMLPFCLVEQKNICAENYETQFVNYREEMIQLIRQISTYAKNRKHYFYIIGNNGMELLDGGDAIGASQQLLLKSLDAMLLESYFYGWDMQSDKLAPISHHQELAEPLRIMKIHNKPLFNIDYCQEYKNIKKSYVLNSEQGFIPFVADSRQLDDIPAYPNSIYYENNKSVNNLAQAKNILVLLNPNHFSNKMDYLDVLGNTNYDVIIMDLYFAGQVLSCEEVNALKFKKNGGRRLVFSYISIGEAESYRDYWQQLWSKNPPQWLEKENQNWEGNYKVQYWRKEWKDILFGSSNAYLDKILAADFDGAFLDVIDAYQYFSTNQDE